MVFWNLDVFCCDNGSEWLETLDIVIILSIWRSDPSRILGNNGIYWSGTKEMCPYTTLKFMFTRKVETKIKPKSKTHFAKDTAFVKDTQHLFHKQTTIDFYQEWYGIVDDRETEMMAVRWKIISFNYQIPLNRQIQIPLCGRFFTTLLSVYIMYICCS